MYHARQHYALAAAVKIDSFAYLPVQDFAFSTFIAQNFGADITGRGYIERKRRKTP